MDISGEQLYDSEEEAKKANAQPAPSFRDQLFESNESLGGFSPAEIAGGVGAVAGAGIGGYTLAQKKKMADLQYRKEQHDFEVAKYEFEQRKAADEARALAAVNQTATAPQTPADVAATQAGSKTPSQVLEEFKAHKAAQQPPAVAPVQPPVQQAPVMAQETPIVSPQASVAPQATPAAQTAQDTVKKVLPTAALPSESEFKPTYKSSTKNPKGPGAYSWVVGQEGSVKGKPVWEDIVGNKNVSYNEFMGTKESPGVLKRTYEAYQGSYGEPDPFKAPSRASANPSPKYVPKYIQGAVSPEMLNSLLNKVGVASALMQSGEAQAPTMRQEQKLQAGRGYVNPPNVDPTDWGKHYPKLIQAIQQLFGDTAPYQH